MGDQKFEKRKICKQINKLQGLKSKADYTTKSKQSDLPVGCDLPSEN